MQYYRCKCGRLKSWGSDGPDQCRKCSDCGTGLGPPGYPMEAVPHEYYESQVETDEGLKPLTRCKWCGRTKTQIEKEAAENEA